MSPIQQFRTLTCLVSLVLCIPTASAEEAALRGSIADDFTLATVGDLLLTRPASMRRDTPFQQQLNILRSASVAFGNFESNAVDIRSFKGYPYGDSGDVWLTAAPELPGDLRAMGFRLLAHANNHSTDWGVEGMRETDRRLDEAGLVHAGTGENRGAARAARYLDTPSGRIALVSFSSTFNVASAAMAPLREAPGRPGLNALRTTPYALVTPAMMNSLRAIRAAQPKGSIDPTLGPEAPDELTLFDVHYRVSDHTGFSYKLNALDRREILQSIRQGRQSSDFLIATIHAHEPGNWSDEPADFLPELAHAAIDAGADVFAGHGPHRLRGIEIYKGKPIFYSLGNFFYQDQLQQPMAADLYEVAGENPNDTTDAELGRKFVDLYFNDPIWYQSVIAVSRYVGGQVAEIRLYPVELGFRAPYSERGVPRLAGPSEAKDILSRLQQLSKPYGTVIEIEHGGVGVISIGAPRSRSPNKHSRVN